MKNTREKNKKTKSVLNYIETLLIILIIIASVIAVHAWARYLTVKNSTNQSEVAKWHFEITNGVKKETGEIEFAMTRTDDNQAVEPGRLAPGTYGEFKIIVDTTGTEVSLTYDIDVNLKECPKNLVFYKVKDITEPYDENAEDTREREELSKFGDKLTISRYLPVDSSNHQSGVYTETVYWTWPIESGTTPAQIDLNDEQDTNDMDNNFTMEIAITGVQATEEVDVNAVTKLAQGSVFNSKIKALAPSVDDIKSFEKSATRPNVESMGDSNIISISNSKSPIYAWFDETDGTVYYWSEDSHIYLNEDASGMFKDLTKIISIDTVNFDTSKVTTMYQMFYNCRNLASLDLNNFNTSRVENMAYLFANCLELTELDVSGFNTSSVITMNYMFGSNYVIDRICYGMKLNAIKGLNSFNTSKVTNMSAMFKMCTNLKSLDVTSFDTSNVTSMDDMFGGNYWDIRFRMNLEEILGIENFDTSKVKTMEYMFGMCYKLADINKYISNFNTSNVTNMRHMFLDCRAITVLDLSNFDTRNVTDCWRMFMECTNLRTIYVSDNFDVTLATTTDGMFRSCTNLVGSMGTRYSSEHQDKEYARIDEGESKPGYFTAKP